MELIEQKNFDRPDFARRSARWRFAVLGRMPTSAAASGTDPPAAT